MIHHLKTGKKTPHCFASFAPNAYNKSGLIAHTTHHNTTARRKNPDPICSTQSITKSDATAIPITPFTDTI